LGHYRRDELPLWEEWRCREIDPRRREINRRFGDWSATVTSPGRSPGSLRVRLPTAPRTRP